MSAEYLLTRGWSEYRGGEYHPARATSFEAWKIGRDKSDESVMNRANYLSGCCMFSSEDYDGAITEFVRCVSYNPGDATARDALNRAIRASRLVISGSGGGSGGDSVAAREATARGAEEAVAREVATREAEKRAAREAEEQAAREEEEEGARISSVRAEMAGLDDRIEALVREDRERFAARELYWSSRGAQGFDNMTGDSNESRIDSLRSQIRDLERTLPARRPDPCTLM